MVLESKNISPHNEILVVTMGTIASTVEEVLAQDNSIALIRLKMSRPFPEEILDDIMPFSGFDRIIVIDRNLSPGQGGHLWKELKALWDGNHFPSPIFGYVVGLNGGDVTPETIKDIVGDACRKTSEDAKKPILWR
jgi:pyruvate/2-oxoacid:ferredoxin oxidoreductase alpha subunit